MAQSAGSPIVGRSAWRHRVQAVLRAGGRRGWDERRLEAEEFIDAGDCVVVLVREFRRGGAAESSWTDTAVVFEVRNGRVVRIQGYMDRAKALKAAGLSESGMSQENVEGVRRGYEHFRETGDF